MQNTVLQYNYATCKQNITDEEINDDKFERTRTGAYI